LGISCKSLGCRGKKGKLKSFRAGKREKKKRRGVVELLRRIESPIRFTDMAKRVLSQGVSPGLAEGTEVRGDGKGTAFQWLGIFCRRVRIKGWVGEERGVLKYEIKA